MPAVRLSLIAALELRILRSFHCSAFIAPCVTLLFPVISSLFCCRLPSDVDEIIQRGKLIRQLFHIYTRFGANACPALLKFLSMVILLGEIGI
jgi:hypothetical protein